MHFQGPEKDKSSRQKSQAKRDIGFNLDEMTAEDFTRGHSLFDYSAQASANPVVQQRQGRVQTTTQKKGVGVNDDPELEKEADEIGKAAAEGKEAETPVSASTGRVDAIQRKISEENSILDDLETTGAGDATKNQDKLTDLNGAEASKKMAETDLVRIKNYIAIFKEAGTNHGLPPALLAAISSRESRGGKLLKEDGYGADDSGFGIMQVDEGSHTLEGTYDSKEHVMQAASILADYHKQVKKKHPDWTKAEQLRGAVAAYNFGVSNVDTLAGIDKGSTGNDYSSDIWTRAKYYASLPEFGASDDAAVVSEASKESTETKENPVEEISAEGVNSDTAATTTSEETSDKVPTAESAATTRDPGQFYTVQKGDNPKMLATIFKTTVEKLKADNEDKWKVWGEKSEGFNAGEKIYISDVVPATIAAIEAERKKAVLDKEEAERLARLKKEQEAKAKKEATENPRKAVEEKKANPAEAIDKIWNEYKSGKLGFIEMGKALIPYGIGNGDKVIEIIDKLGDYSKDDLSYVITSNSSPAILSSLDKSLLSRMSAELGNIWITKSWFMHSEQKERIDRVLNSKETTKEADRSGDKKESAKSPEKNAFYNADFTLSGSVGSKGKNKAKDLVKVQNLLVSLNYLASNSSEILLSKGIYSKTPDTIVEESKLTETIAAIKQYQKYGATTSSSLKKQNGRIDKGGYTHKSMIEMNRVYNKYNKEEFAVDIPDVLSKSEWRSQFRYGYNFKNGEDSKEKEYIDYVKEKTGLNDPSELHTASAEKINDVHKAFAGDWKSDEILKTNAIKMNQKSRDTKPNHVCCWDTAKLMLGFTGASAKEENSKIQTFVAESGTGKITNQAALGVKYIDAQLKAGKGVFVGIEKGKTKTINEGTTDHFIIIVGKHKNGAKWYYNYFDPGTRNKESGYSKEHNRLYIGTDKSSVENEKIKLSQIRVNNE